MTDVFLYQGEASQNDVKLTDPTVLSGLAAIAGVLAATEADDTLAGAATLAIAATAGISEAEDTLSGAAALTIAASASITEANDSESATGALPIVGIEGTTESDDTLSSASALAIGATAGFSEAGDTLAAGAALAITGSLAISEENDAASAAAEIVESEPAVAPSASAGGGRARFKVSRIRHTRYSGIAPPYVPPGIAAEASITEGGDTLAATAVIRGIGSLKKRSRRAEHAFLLAA